MKRITLIVVAFGIILPFAGASGQSAGGSSKASFAKGVRPSNVPSEYAATPFGYFHPSCVQQLAKGERLLSDGRVQHANGQVEANAATCGYPRYTSSGAVATGSPDASPEFSGWVADANMTTGSLNRSYGALIATWTVPPQPTVNNGQWLFFFPGFEDINDPQTSILQPVLQWSQGQWAIASWNCCMSGVAAESPVVKVRSGDLIYGSITSNCPAGTLSCPSWNVLTLDMSTGDSTTLSNTPSESQVFNWAFAGAVEAYYVTSCDDYPSNRSISFGNVTVFDQNLNPIVNPEWTQSVNNYQQPQCGYGVRTARSAVSLGF